MSRTGGMALLLVALLWLPSCVEETVGGPFAGPIRLQDPAQLYLVGRHMEVLADGSGTLTLPQAMAAEGWQRPAVNIPSYPIGERVMWARFDLVDETAGAADWVLDVMWRRPQEIDLWVAQGSGYYHERHGRTLERSSLKNPGRRANLNIPLPKGQRHTVYVRSRSNIFSFYLRIAARPTYTAENYKGDLLLGAYFGLVLGLAAYNLFLFASLGEVSYLYYVLFALFTALFQAGRTGLKLEYFTPQGDPLAYTGGATATLALVPAALFIQSFLQTRDHLPRLHRVVSWVVAACGVATVMGVAGLHAASVVAAPVLGLAVMGLAVCAGLLRAHSGHTPAFYFLVAWGAFIAGMVLFSGRVLGLLPLNLATTHGLMTGSALDLVLLSLGLGERVRVLRREQAEASRLAEAARADALQTQLDAAERIRALNQRLAAQVISTQESERARIAADLHDDIGHRLLVIHGDARELADAGVRAGEDSQVSARLSAIVAQAGDAIRDVRSIAHNLHPAHLEQLGLAETLRSMGEALARAHDVEVEVQVEEAAVEAVGVRAIHLYRVAQEALSNAVRHGRAAHLELYLRRRDGRVELEIGDNGCGFDTTLSPGIGLRAMGERAQVLQGTLQLQSAPGEGTSVVLSILIEQDATARAAQ